jgi:gluconolactonase
MSSPFVILSEEFRRILGPAPKLKLLSEDFIFAEGVCWVEREQFLVVSDFFNDRIMKWTEREGLGVFRQPSQTANGNTVDAEGRVISCLTRGRSVVRFEHDGSQTVLADKYRGGKLTSPNDVVVSRDGAVWFTDPDYGWLVPAFGHGQPPEQDRNRVYRIDLKTGDVTAVSEDFDKPNGICFSPDERTLYVGDTGMTHGAFRPHRIMAFDVNADGTTLSNPRIFADINSWVPDGFRCDTDGNLYVGAGDGVQVFTSTGEMIGRILTPETVGNLSFGMSDRQTLFIGATKSLWSIRLNAAGPM